ncbi:hypothetical protein H2200_003046 [Cladophialophora chaetospira]|uniref:BTB domain-containing protein n=1 Tax=Cladophialophora chaetospira TaxID=386627 RepID=A0AA38XGL5_9EURO|nr:hypothetical protein H2200_003046 [Cladophialophora chaetospira]
MPEDDPSKPPRVPLGTDTVKVLVGPSTRPYEVVIHKNLLCTASQFFSAALEGHSVEAHEQEVRFSEDDPRIFKALHDWLYDKLPGTSAPRWFRKRKDAWHMYWFNAFCLADRLSIPNFQIFTWHQIKEIFNSTTPVRPSNDMLEEIWHHNTFFGKELSEAGERLRYYIVAHVFYWIWTGKAGHWMTEVRKSAEGDPDPFEITLAMPYQYQRSAESVLSACFKVVECASSNSIELEHPSCQSSVGDTHDNGIPELTNLIPKLSRLLVTPYVATMSNPQPSDPPRVPRGTETVKVIVGDGHDTHAVIMYKNLLCCASKFFRVALEGPFLEAQNQEVKLPEEEI